MLHLLPPLLLQHALLLQFEQLALCLAMAALQITIHGLQLLDLPFQLIALLLNPCFLCLQGLHFYKGIFEFPLVKTLPLLVLFFLLLEQLSQFLIVFPIVSNILLQLTLFTREKSVHVGSLLYFGLLLPQL